MKMMKNLMLVLMMVCVLAACKKEKPKDVVLNAKPATQLVNGMPGLTMNMTDGTNVTMTDLDGKVLLVCYNPGCDHCQREAKLLSENKDLFEGYKVFFLTPEPIEEAAKFQKEYNLEEPNIHFGRAEVPAIMQAVGVISTVPTIFVYRDQALVKRLQGEVSLNDLRAAMQ
jgi:peroxiredoxin